MREVWKPVLGYENHYAVSNLGRVKRIAPGRSTWINRILAPMKNKDGYVSVALSNGKLPKVFQIHRLVLIAFRGQFPKGKNSSHLNGIRDDNRLKNLAFMTQRENILYGRDFLGTKHGVNGHKHPFSKLTEIQVRKIRKLRKNTKMTQEKIAGLFGVHRVTIHDIWKRRSWRHI